MAPWTDTFPGASGAALDASYTVHLTESKASAPVHTGAGGVRHDTPQGDSLAVRGDAADVSLSAGCAYTTQIRRRWVLAARVPTPGGSSTGGYQARLWNDATTAPTWKLQLLRSGAQVAVTSNFSPPGANVWMRLEVEGAVVRARWWPDDGAEPSTWHLTYTDPLPLPSGAYGFGVYNSGNRQTTNLGPFVAEPLGAADTTPPADPAAVTATAAPA